MIRIRRSEERGRADHGWLDSRHTFSFDSYYDPAHMGFRTLRVINEDRVAPGAGFPTHPHRDMEIISFVLEGAIAHEDSMGSRHVLRPGEVQRMTAGTGVTHSEFNPSATEPLHFLQIWILPERRGLPPGYEQKAFLAEERKNRLRLVASRDGRDGSLTIHQDVRLYSTVLDSAASVDLELAADRHVWVQVARGTIAIDEHELHAGDGAAISNASRLAVHGIQSAEVLVFDLA